MGRNGFSTRLTSDVNARGYAGRMSDGLRVMAPESRPLDASGDVNGVPSLRQGSQGPRRIALLRILDQSGSLLPLCPNAIRVLPKVGNDRPDLFLSDVGVRGLNLRFAHPQHDGLVGEVTYLDARPYDHGVTAGLVDEGCGHTRDCSQNRNGPQSSSRRRGCWQRPVLGERRTA